MVKILFAGQRVCAENTGKMVLSANLKDSNRVQEIRQPPKHIRYVT